MSLSTGVTVPTLDVAEISRSAVTASFAVKPSTTAVMSNTISPPEPQIKFVFVSSLVNNGCGAFSPKTPGTAKVESAANSMFVCMVTAPRSRSPPSLTVEVTDAARIQNG